jgi:hypothetical protein
MLSAEPTERWERAAAERLARDLDPLARAASRSAGRGQALVRAAARRGLAAGVVPDLHGLVRLRLLPALTRAMALAHMVGRRRSAIEASRRDGEIAMGDVYAEVKRVLRRTLGLRIGDLERAYGRRAARALRDSVDGVDRRVRGTLFEVARNAPDRAMRLLTRGLEGAGVDPLSAARLETVFRSAMLQAASAGRWEADQELGDELWGYRYVQIDRPTKRDEHVPLHGVTLPKDDPFWLTYWPPNGWNCGCQAVPLYSPRRVRRPTYLPHVEPPFDRTPEDWAETLGLSSEWREEDHPRDDDGRFVDKLAEAERRLDEALKEPSAEDPPYLRGEDLRLVKRLGLRYDGGEGLVDNLSPEAEEAIAQANEEREFDVSKLEATQHVVHVEKVRGMLRRDRDQDRVYNRPLVAKFEDRLYVVDGTHRVVADGLLGQKVRADYVDLDAVYWPETGLAFAGGHYDPNQPRVPAGESTGGQWTSATGLPKGWQQRTQTLSSGRRIPTWRSPSGRTFRSLVAAQRSLLTTETARRLATDRPTSRVAVRRALEAQQRALDRENARRRASGQPQLTMEQWRRLQTLNAPNAALPRPGEPSLEAQARAVEAAARSRAAAEAARTPPTPPAYSTVPYVPPPLPDYPGAAEARAENARRAATLRITYSRGYGEGGTGAQEAVDAAARRMGFASGAEAVAACGVPEGHAATASWSGVAAASGSEQISVGSRGVHESGGRYSMSRTLYRNGPVRSLSNNSFSNEHHGTGMGAQVIHDASQALAAHGFSHISVSAAQGGGYNGGLTWPRLGFDARVADLGSAALREYGQRHGLTRLSDFMRSAEHRAFYDRHPTSFSGRFDLTPGSTSHAIVKEAHARAKAKQRREAVPRARTNLETARRQVEEARRALRTAQTTKEGALQTERAAETRLREVKMRVAREEAESRAAATALSATKEWVEADHPRAPPGGPDGGEFVAKSDYRIDVEDPEGLLEATGFEPDEIAEIVGALPGADVTIKVTDEDGETMFEVDVDHGQYAAHRIVRPEAGVVHNSSLTVYEGSPKGTGTRILARQVRAAAASGFQRLEAFAAGEHLSENVGYFVWPLLGYDGDVPPAAAPYAREHGLQRMSDFMRTQEHRDWWLENGSAFDAEFDLREGSLGRAVLETHVKKNAIKLSWTRSTQTRGGT